MAKEANKTVIGLFVVGAIVLLVVALVVFGGGKFFKETNRFVAFFEGSVKGLSIGSPVMFRGVRIGKVDDFKVYYDTKDETFKIPVMLTLFPEKIHGIGMEEEFSEAENLEMWQQMLEDGFRAELQMQSLVTGQVGIQMDFYPGRPLKLYGLEEFDLPPDLKEIPTIQSGFQQLTKTIEEIPLDKIAKDVQEAVKGINKLVNSPEVAKTLRNIEQTTKEARDLLRHIDEKVDPLFAQVDQTLKDSQGLIRSVDQTSDDTRKLVNNVNSRIEPVQADWTATTKELREALIAAEGALESIDDMVDENSEFRYQVDAFLNEISLMARSLRAFADHLERNPDALLRGKIRRTGQQ